MIMISGNLQPGQAGPTLTEEDKKRLQALSMKSYGSPIENLSDEQRQALFANYDETRRMYTDMLMSEGPKGKQMGNVYVAPTWSENLAGAVQKGIGGYGLGQTNKRERLGRETAGDLAAEEAARRRLRDEEDRKREDDRFTQLVGMFGSR
jgi:hypothetical protein